jgi:hypothetical protein
VTFVLCIALILAIVLAPDPDQVSDRHLVPVTITWAAVVLGLTGAAVVSSVGWPS